MKKFLKRFVVYAMCAICIAVFMWVIISWVDVLMHNDPVTGDKQYMPGNAIAMMVELAE